MLKRKLNCDQEGGQNPTREKAEGPERGGRVRQMRENYPSRCRGQVRSEAEDSLAMISHSGGISVTGGVADEKDARK